MLKSRQSIFANCNFELALAACLVVRLAVPVAMAAPRTFVVILGAFAVAVVAKLIKRLARP